MENFIIYMIKAAGLTALFYLAYHTLLRKETFFTSNRWFLLAGLFTSALLPLIVYTKTIWVDPIPAAPVREIDINQLLMVQQAMASQQQESISINWYDVAAGIYLAGIALFLIRFTLDIVSLKRLLKGHRVTKEKNFRLIDSDKIRSPFSFFNYIVYNSKALQPDELESIISHEKVHSAQKHSLDMVISQLFCAFFWFNPFAWMYKKSISQNLEFIADAEAAKRIANKKAYQKTLLKITIQPECIAITNHFYQSLIKKRIVMLNKKQSKKMNSWKYATVLPALAAFIFLFQVKVVAQEKETPGSATAKQEKTIILEITKDTKDSQLAEETTTLKKDFGTEIAFDNVTRNEKDEITGIKVSVKDRGQSNMYQVSGTEPIKPFTIQIARNGSKSNISIGAASNFVISGGNIAAGFASNDTVKKRSQLILKNLTTPKAGSGSNTIVRADKIEIDLGDNNKTLVIVNGEKQKKGDPVTVPSGEQIESVTILDKKEAKKKYGKEGKNGALEITTQESTGQAYILNGAGAGAMIYEIPGMPDMEYHFEMPEVEFYDDHFKNIEKEMKVFKEIYGSGANVKLYSIAPSGEEIEAWAKLRELTPNAPNVEMLPGYRQMTDDQLQEVRKQMEETRKQMEAMRKDMDAARKEMQKTRDEMMKARKAALDERKAALEERREALKTRYS